MKRFIAAIAAAAVLLTSANVWAMPTEYSGGVNNEYEYEEFAFLSGVPVRFTGTYKITESEKKDSRTVTYTFKLTSSDSGVTGKLDRQMTYQTTYDRRIDRGQTIAQISQTKMKETVTIGNDKYELKDYQFSKSDIIDNRPAADFYSGNVKARKYYTINGTEGKAVVDISGGEVGYDNFWGNTGTQILDYVISVERQAVQEEGTDGGKDRSWEGMVRIQASDSTTKTVKYSENEANFSSFEGGHLKVTNREMVSRFEYDLPVMDNSIPHKTKRNMGIEELSRDMDPKIERLILPKFKDLGGHWAEEDINRLYSLGIFEEFIQFFTPDIPMTREEYVKAVMKACNISIPAVQTRTTSARSKTPEVPLFNDVDVMDKDYVYIKEGASRGIIRGVSSNSFMPDAPLTRAEAIVVIMRALGFDNKAPSPGYSTAFDDDADIPEWSKDGVYVAREVGLVQGDGNNRFNPNQIMSRAEASAMISRFLVFLEKDLQKDYRENILLFN